MKPDRSSPALSHPVRVEQIRPRGTQVTLQAEADQLAAIAKTLGLASVETLDARYDLSRNGERVKLEGRIKAQFHQICVVSVESFPVVLDVPIKLDLVPASDPIFAVREAGSDEGAIDIEVMLNEADPPEPIVDGVIDLGAITQEFLALALDPYPRKPGVAFEPPAAAEPEPSPFAALAKLRRDG
ncbi:MULTISPECIES: hypothetical protein [unclassified Bosea (in: a-proteobacteria)]|uniref:YceD family protein n=1 Tax=unclassified Bosea (in: a-proteobacteria) TaxID=2653178 RepID=UPI000953B080|nr:MULTISPECIES: hypothetical protein [unclassified Bosea (in: a-proteobacteria)]TAJ30147.1 MAG: DUF177 domain-containing protein [Bosea sp. (in: a-proteobacteria)]SIP93454.1 Uncharacterized ACR, COG1399 [Bosea sp. TND4EK4]